MARKPDPAAIYERKGGKLEPVSLSAHAVGVTSPRLALTPLRRGVANYYGACAERVTGGAGVGGGLQEAVDGGKGGDGGSLALVDMRRAVTVAQTALRVMPLLTYIPRSSYPTGPHEPIRMQLLVDAVCVYGHELDSVARTFGWFIMREEDRSGVTVAAKVIPKQQRQKVKAALDEALDAVIDAWTSEGVRVPAWVGSVEVG